MLNYYIGEEDNYVVTGAVISCDQMSDKPVYIKREGNRIEITGEMGKKVFQTRKGGSGQSECYEAHKDAKGSRRLYAVHAADQTTEGRTFATVRDCTCLRDKEEKKKRGQASIISLGNCKLMEETDAEEIEKRKEKAYRYGTCYCLIKPDDKWVNPYCMESVVGECHENNGGLNSVLTSTGVADILMPRPTCKKIEHHSTMKWSTDNGLEEGITMLSTLLCTRGGIITIEKSGQIVQNNYEVFALARTVKGEHRGALSQEQMESNAEYVYNYLRRKGWSIEAICGLLGNMSCESGVNPGAWEVWESKINGYGLVQWTKASDYLDYADLEPNEVNELAETDPKALMDSQLEFLMLTLESDEVGIGRWMIKGVQTYYNKLPLSEGVSGAIEYEKFYQSTYSPGDLALIFHACYERSGNGAEVLKDRAKAAEDWYTHFTEQ